MNAELGGEAGHGRLCAALAVHGLGQVVDIVPNHMAITGPENAWWWDVLENGPSSRYASYFDVDWDPPEAKLRNTVLLPILGDHYGRVLEAGEIHIERRIGTLRRSVTTTMVFRSPRSLDDLLSRAAERIGSDELGFAGDRLRATPLSTRPTGRASTNVTGQAGPRAARAPLLTRIRLARPVDAVVAEINADPDSLDGLLERQNYRLAFWRTAGRELDYRRFFDITTLVGLRVEDDRVFDETHALPLRWLASGRVQGLRVDHPDGLRDPEGYLRRLRSVADGAWIGVEKILETGERLPSTWPVAGTTGYDFLNLVGGLFIDPGTEREFTALYESFTGSSGRFHGGGPRAEAPRAQRSVGRRPQPAHRAVGAGRRAPPSLS